MTCEWYTRCGRSSHLSARPQQAKSLGFIEQMSNDLDLAHRLEVQESLEPFRPGQSRRLSIEILQVNRLASGWLEESYLRCPKRRQTAYHLQLQAIQNETL